MNECPDCGEDDVSCECDLNDAYGRACEWCGQRGQAYYAGDLVACDACRELHKEPDQR